MINERLTEELLEENIVTLIEDEDYSGGLFWEVVGSITAVATLLGVSSGCTKACWRP